MTPPAIIAAIERLSTFDLARLLESSAFWSALGLADVLLEDATFDEICDELEVRGLTPATIERLREFVEDGEAIEYIIAAPAASRVQP